MNYIVIELQTTGSITAHIVTKHTTRAEAESKFHQVLSAAAVSSVPVHTAVMLDEEGYPVRPPECYKHTPAPETVEPVETVEPAESVEPAETVEPEGGEGE